MPEVSICFLQPYEVLSAVERRDIMYLMEIRDRAFPVRLVFPHLNTIDIDLTFRGFQ